MKKTIFFFFLLIPSFLLAGCSSRPETNKSNTSGEESSDTAIVEDNNTTTSLANPASTNCVTQGGEIIIKTRKLGEYGVCLFEDNRQCEEWALLRGQCPIGGLKITGYENEAQIYCAITGGTVEGVGTETPLCRRTDGTLCNVQSNFDGDCPDPNDPEPNAGNSEGI